MISAIKRSAWLIAVLLLALTFPMQVVFDSASMALLAYIPVFLIYMLPNAPQKQAPALFRLDGVDIIVGLYTALILGHLLLSLMIGKIAVTEACRLVFVFILPATFYLYTSRWADELELKSILLGIIIAALIIGIYFAYDSYTKMILQQISDYQRKAHQYGIDRMGSVDLAEISPTRLGVQYRSMGLLESHTVSGAWLGFGAFASFFFLSAKSKTTRSIIGLGWLIMLVLGFNFTSILAYMITTFIIYGWNGTGHNDFLKIRKSSMRRAVILFTLASIALAICLFYSKDFADKILSLVAVELSLIFTSDIDMTNPNSSWLSWTLIAMQSFSEFMAQRPLSWFWGNGPVGADNWAIGGNTGFLDTISILGLPLFIAIVVGLLRILRTSLGQSASDRTDQSTMTRHGFLEFGLCTILFIFIFEAHYSAWIFKSVSPILFIALGLIRRYGRERHRKYFGRSR